ncbi:MAG: hypothetical protein KA536_21555 [Saprospiraceae bacterium]|nr:hypothetical protein [Saprospiraceae bacterium]
MKYEIDIFEFMKLAELCFYSRTGVSISFIDKAIRLYHDMPKNDKIRMHILVKQINKDIFAGDKILDERQGKFLALFDADNQYKVTVGKGKQRETRFMYLYAGRYWDNVNTYAPKENIVKIEKISTD